MNARFAKSSRLVVAVLVVAGCVGCTRLEPSDDLATDEAPDALALDLPPEIAGSVLRLALVRPASLDPSVLSMADQGAVIVSDLLYDGLTESTADGRLGPALATGWSSSADFATWTFTLDSDRTTAETVRASFERVRASAPASPAAALLSSVATIDLVDPATIRFVLSSPNAGFAWLLSGLPFSIVGEAGTWSGRFALVEDESEFSVLTAGEGDDAISVKIEWVADDAAAQADAATGAVDGAVVPVGESDRASREVGASPSARSIVRFYELDPTGPALSDLRVRQAVLAAVDRSVLVERLGSPAFVADAIVGATSAGFQNDACGATCAFDPERARALVAEVGTTATIRIGFTTEHEAALAASIVEQLGVAGLAAEQVEIAAGQLTIGVDGVPVDLFPYGWVASAGSVDAIIPPLLGSASTVNPLGSITPEIDQAITAAMTTEFDDQRWALLGSAHEQALAHAVLLPVAVAQNRFVVSPAFSGVVTRADGSIEIRSLP